MLRQLLCSGVVFIAALSASNASNARPWDPVPQNGSPQGVIQNNSVVPPVIVPLRPENPSEEDLRKQLLLIPETGFDQLLAARIYSPIQKDISKIKSLRPDLGPVAFQQVVIQLRKPEQFSFPWRVEPDCSMGKEASERLHVLSLHLRDCLRKSTPKGDVRPDPDKLRTLLRQDSEKAQEWKTPQAIPTLMQLLQSENHPIRMLLIELLGNISGKESSAALAQRALFDLSAEVREKAIQALARRPPDEYQQVLMRGLRYPWPPAADHAGEAVAALKLTAVLPDLVNMLKEPSPTLPIKRETGYRSTELVRINHMSNCLLCHAPSLAKDDLIRGRIPIPGEDPPPLYYHATSGLFVRANTTYLRQDFSVVQPVPNPAKWPANQRYDYVLRSRELSKSEVKRFLQLENGNQLPKTYPQRDSVLFALRQVTKADVGDSFEAWSAELPRLLGAAKAKGQ